MTFVPNDMHLPVCEKHNFRGTCPECVSEFYEIIKIDFAISFANWISDEGYIKRWNGWWYKWGRSPLTNRRVDDNIFIDTTEELIKKYKQWLTTQKRSLK